MTPRSDIFSLGVMLYEMTTGVLPFDGDNDYDMMEAIVHGRYTPPLTRNPKLDPLIAQVIEKAIKPEPADRFASCEEMAAVLAGEKKLADVAKSSTPEPVRPPTPPPTDVAAKQATASTALTTPPATQNSSGSGRLIGFGLLALALAVGGLAIVFALKKDTPATTQNQSGTPAVSDPDVPSDATLLATGIAYPRVV